MTTDSTRSAFAVFFAVLTFLFCWMLWPFAKPAFLAFTLSIIFEPLYALIYRRLWRQSYLAAGITTLIILACVIGPLTAIGFAYAEQTGVFLKTIAQQFSPGSLSALLTPALAKAQSLLGQAGISTPQQLEGIIIDVIKIAGEHIYAFSPRVLMNTVAMASTVFFMLIFLVVFMAEGHSLAAGIRSVSPLAGRHLGEIAEEVRSIINSSLLATIVVGFVQGSLLGIGFWVAGIPHAFSWWLVAIIVCLVPVIGTPGCYATASLALWLGGRAEAAILFLLFGLLIVSTIDNVLRPLLMRGRMRIHPVLLFVALIGGMRLMGGIGIVVGPVLLSIFLASLRIYQREFSASGQHLSTGSS